MLGIFIAIGLSSPAFAGGACPTSPSNWDAASCGGICTFISGPALWVCDVSGAGGPSNVWMVQDYTSNAPFEAWGDSNGTLFCCTSTGFSPTKVAIKGSAYSDYLAFEWSLGTYNMHGGGGTIAALIAGGAGTDYIHGSSDASAYYDEELDGDDDADYIYGNAGIDVINGGDGDDVCEGDDGGDFMFGDAGDDELDGNDGDDKMFGGDGNDLMWGEDGADEMDGGQLDDIMYGGDGADEMEGASGEDVLYGEGDGDPFLDGGDDHDIVYGDGGVDAIWGNLAGGSDVDYLSGGDGDDTLLGDDGNDIICGDGDVDTLYGEAGDDIVFGGGAYDTTNNGGGGTDACENDSPVACESWATECPAW